MAFEPTKMQEKAIYTKGNVLVSAAAGSGKTAVLTERVVSMLKDPEKPISADRLLIVTFTNAAAAEMRTRIEKKLIEEMQKQPDNTALIKQKYLLSSADISTIDSFCIRMLRENFEKCDIEPDFKIIEKTDENLITKNILNELIVEALQNKPNELKVLLELTGCENNEENLCDTVKEIQLYMNQLPFPKDYIAEFLVPYETEFDEGNVWYDYAFQKGFEIIDKIKEILPDFEHAASMTQSKDSKYTDYSEKFVSQLTPIFDCSGQKNWDNMHIAVQNFIPPDASKHRISAKDASGQQFKRLKFELLAKVSKLQELFYARQADIKLNMQKVRPAIKLLVDMIISLDERLFASLKEKNAYTFYNIEQMAFDLLCKKQGDEIAFTDYAVELAGRYDEVLVDEFQDVNDLQDRLFWALSNREEKLFVVGDVKQSIYGFRGSNPDNFLNKRNSYIDIEKASDTDSKKIILADNFRSRKGVCDAVNYFFSIFLAGQSGGLVYDESEYLNAGGTFPESDAGCCELLVVDKSNQTNQESVTETEAKKIAEYILSVMNEGEVITDGNIKRRARFDDFAILLDKASSTAPTIAQILSEYDIPVSFSGGSFLEAYEVSTVLSLLQVIDNPKNDVELLQVMMSPLFAFTADEMALIRSNNNKCTLYSSLVDFAASGNQKAADCLKKLSEFRQSAAVLSVDRLISSILYSTDIFNQMSALSGGQMRRTNLQALIGYAKSYYDSFGGGVYGFIKYIKALNDKDLKVSSAGQGVKLMTMHGSKGLQFPVCIIASMTSRMNKSETTSSIIYKGNYGIAFKYYDEDQSTQIEMVGHSAMKEEANTKLTGEKLRLLYVAMTRAIDRLCLVCTLENYDKHITELAKQVSDTPDYLSREFLESKSNMGDWILGAMLLHPNGEGLRTAAGSRLSVIESDSQIDVDIIDIDNTLNIDTAEERIPQVDVDLVQKIKDNIGYSYPYEALKNVQAKASVSSLVHGADNDRFAFSERPAFMTNDRLSGAERGTAIHHIMQFIEFSERVDVGAELERLVEWKFITEQEAASADISAIEKFFASDIYARIMRSGDVHREMRFLTEIPAGRFNPDMQGVEGADIIVQGAVDLCFVEDDGIVVLDFKTDREDDPQSLKDYYAEQLNIYSTAVEKIFKKPVKERIIYSLYLGKTISF